MISANVIPQNTAMSSVLLPILTNMNRTKNLYGAMYYPPMVTTLTDWKLAHAYQIRMNAAATLPITGAAVVPETTPIVLNQTGIYWLPYYRTSPMATATALATISGKYLQIKDIQGRVYQPPFSMSLAQLAPNNGYIIRMKNATGTLTYPANGAIKSSASQSVEIMDPAVFVRENNITSKTAFIALDINNIEDGDEIGVFTEGGILVGSSVWQYGMHGVVVWGDDEYTNEIDGAAEGEALTLKVWSKATKNIGEVSQIALSDMTTNAQTFDLTYETDAVNLLKGAAEMDNNSKQISISPQPANSELPVKFGVAPEHEVSIKIFNQAGKLSFETTMSASSGLIKLNTSDLSSGVYQMLISVGDKTYSKKVVIVK